MAKIRDVAVTIEAATVSSSVLEMPVHETGDLLVLIFNKDSTNGGPASVSGWSVPTAWGSNPLNTAGSGNYLFAKRAASSNETVTLTYTIETSLTAVIAIQDVFGTTVNDAFVAADRAGADDTTLPLNGGSGFTPANANSLILGFLGTDTGFGPENLPGRFNALVSADAGSNSLAVCYTVAPDTSSLDHPGYWGQSQDDSRYALIEIRSAAGVGNHAYLDDSAVPATLIAGMVNNTSAVNQGTFKAGTNPALDITSVNGITLNGRTAITNANDLGYNPFWGATRITTTSSKTVMDGQELTFTSPKDFTAGLGVLFGTIRYTNPRDYVDNAIASKGGVLVGIADAENDSRWWQIAAQFALTTASSDRMNYAIEVADNSSDFFDSGTLALDAINDFYIAARGYYGACGVEFSKLALLNKCVLAGGTATFPFNFIDFTTAVNTGTNLPLAQVSGSAVKLWTPVQFGGGDPCHTVIQLRTFQFPQKADGAKYLDFHVSNDRMGIEFYGKDRGGGDADTIAFIGCVFTAEQSYYWRFNAAHAAGTNLSFAGSTIVGANVTLQPSVSIFQTTFTNCTGFAQNGALLAFCTFNNTTVVSADIADLANMLQNTFNSTAAGHAIVVGAAGAAPSAPDNETTVSGTFNDYAAEDGSTGDEAIHVLYTSGTVVITVQDGTVPSIRTDGAAVTVVTGQVLLSLVGNVSLAGAEIRIYDLDNNPAGSFGTELAGVESNPDPVFQYIGSSGNTVRIQVMKSGYEEFSRTTVIPDASGTYDVILVEDANL